MFKPFESNLAVVLSITPLLLRVANNLFAEETVFPGKDDEEILICLVKLFDSVFDSKPTAANPLVTADKLGVFPCSIVSARDNPDLTVLACSLDKTPAEDSAFTVEDNSGSLPVLTDFTPDVIRLVACNNDIMLFHIFFYSVQIWQFCPVIH